MTTTHHHPCPFDWCDHAADTHFTMIYTPTTHPAFRPHTVGCGVDWHEGEDGSNPAVVVHIRDTDGGVDTDAHLRLSEAIELRERLDRAIGIVASIADEIDGGAGR